MDADYAFLPADLEGGEGGGAVALGMRPYPAWSQPKEKQPFTWLGAVPYIVVLLVAAVLLVVGTVMCVSDDLDHPFDLSKDWIGMTILCSGMLVLVFGLLWCGTTVEEGGCAWNLPRLGPDDD